MEHNTTPGMAAAKQIAQIIKKGLAQQEKKRIAEAKNREQVMNEAIAKKLRTVESLLKDVCSIISEIEDDIDDTDAAGTNIDKEFYKDKLDSIYLPVSEKQLEAMHLADTFEANADKLRHENK